MKTTTVFFVGIALCIGASRAAGADNIIINPSDDGALYVCDGCNTVNNGAYVLVAGYIQGIVRFPTAPISGPIGQAFLTVNPYALPLGDLNINVYGITAGGPSISASDANAGTLLGTMHLPPNLGYGQDALFDVTAFLAGARSPYVGFNLRNAAGADVFSSLEYNYGHPSQLRVTLVPEPTTITLLSTGIGLIAICSARRVVRTQARKRGKGDKWISPISEFRLPTPTYTGILPVSHPVCVHPRIRA